MTTARRVAWECLQRIDHDDAYANLVVPARLTASGLDRRDRAFVTELVYGATRMRRALDASIDRFVSKPPEPAVRSLLRLGAYQLMFAGTPGHAAVDETVTLAPNRARGFVNAVLRRVAGTPMSWPGPAVELSYPDWIVDRLSGELGPQRAIATLRAMNRPASARARDDGYVQDPGSRLVVDAVDAGPGQRILDVCAAPGGKATGMAAAGAWVVAADSNPGRVGLIRSNVATLGADVSIVVADGTAPSWRQGVFDAVLIDAPCSGLGTLARRPDARWRVTPADVDTLVALQSRLIAAAAPLVRPGGRLVYSVCTLLRAESVDHAIPGGYDVDPTAPAGPWEAVGHGWRLTPDIAETDGMILVRMTRHG